MKTLTLIRHTTPLIAPGICYGQLDIGLTKNYTGEAAIIKEWLDPVDLVLTSPLLRTQELAENIASDNGCEMRHDARLMEMNFGDWEGRAWNDIARSEIDAWSADVLHYFPPNGESAQQMMRRVQSMLQDLALLPQQHIAIVAHGGSIRAVLAQLAAIPLTYTLNWQIDYGAVISTRCDFSSAIKSSPIPQPRQK